MCKLSFFSRKRIFSSVTIFRLLSACSVSSFLNMILSHVNPNAWIEFHYLYMVNLILHTFNIFFGHHRVSRKINYNKNAGMHFTLWRHFYTERFWILSGMFLVKSLICIIVISNFKFMKTFQWYYKCSFHYMKNM